MTSIVSGDFGLSLNGCTRYTSLKCRRFRVAMSRSTSMCQLKWGKGKLLLTVGCKHCASQQRNACTRASPSLPFRPNMAAYFNQSACTYCMSTWSGAYAENIIV